MTKFNDVLEKITERFKNIKYNGDLSDLGNEIGIIIAPYINKETGYNVDDFIHGLKHGISLIDGTHQKSQL